MSKKIKYILPFSVLGILVVLFISALQFVKKFNDLSNIEKLKTPFDLKSNRLYLLNVVTKKTDTILLNGLNVVNFWASWCKPCIEEMPALERLQSKNRDVQFILLSFDSLKNQINTITKENWILPAYFIKDTTLFKQPPILPMTYIIRDSVVLEVIYGKQNWPDSSLNLYKKDGQL
jgi:thiol-disulfide isomerase/thioredoxin